jgi:hypothetical protein
VALFGHLIGLNIIQVYRKRVKTIHVDTSHIPSAGHVVKKAQGIAIRFEELATAKMITETCILPTNCRCPDKSREESPHQVGRDNMESVIR